MQSSIVEHVSPMDLQFVIDAHSITNYTPPIHELTLLQEQNMYKFTPVRLVQLQGCKF